MLKFSIRLFRPFLYKALYLPNIEIRGPRLFLGLFLGLLFSFALYSWAYIIREVMRLLSVSFNYDLWILTDKEVGFYNLFYAFVSVIIGQSVCFTFWIERPKRIFTKHNFRIKPIVNDQRNLNWYFICWFSKMAFIYGLIFGITIPGGFYNLELYHDYTYLFIIISVVLFLHTWSSVRLAFKRNVLKWMFVSGLLISLISFGMSKINMVNYKALNHAYLKQNVYYNYKLELPESDYFEKLYKLSFIENIYLVKSDEIEKSDSSLILIENQIVPVSNVSEKIEEILSRHDNYEKSEIVFQLTVHQGINMGFLNRVKKELSRCGISRIAYAVVPSNREFDKSYYRNYVVKMHLPKFADTLMSTFYKNCYEAGRHSNTIEIILSNKDDCKINNVSVPYSKLVVEIKKQILKESNYIIKIYTTDKIMFKEYSKILFSAMHAIAELRNEYALKTYLKAFERIKTEQADSIREKFPMRIIELEFDSLKLKKN